MPRNSSGVYVLPAGNPVVTGTIIESDWANTTLDDVATALGDSLDRQGRGGMLAPLRGTDGTVGVPAYAFTAATGTGLYRSVEGVHVAVDGVEQLLVSSTPQADRSQLTEAPLNGLSYSRKDGAWEQVVTGAVALLPVGAVISYSAESVVPAGWLVCDGSAVSRALYPELNSLYAAGSYPYGPGDGSTTFNVPDLVGRAAIGAGTGDASDATEHLLGEKKGAETHTLTVDEIPSHTHSGTPSSTTVESGTNQVSNSGAPVSGGAAGGGQAHNNMQPYTALVWLVKATGDASIATDTVLVGMSLQEEQQPTGLTTEFVLEAGYDYEIKVLNARPSIEDYLVMEYSATGVGGPWNGAGFSVILDGVESDGVGNETPLQFFSGSSDAILGYDAANDLPAAQAIVVIENHDSASTQTTSNYTFFSRSSTPLYRYGTGGNINNTARIENAVRIRWFGGASFVSGTVIRLYRRSRTARDTIVEGHTIQEEGVSLNQRPTLDFVGAGVTATDDVGNNKTIVTIPGGGSGSGNVSFGVPFVDGDIVQVQDAVSGIIQTAGVALSNIPKLDASNSFSAAQFVDGSGNANAALGVTETTRLDDATLSAWGGGAELSLRATNAAVTVGQWHNFHQTQSRLQLERWNFSTGIPEDTDVMTVESDGGFAFGGALNGSQGSGTLNAKGLFIDGVPVASGSGDVVGPAIAVDSNFAAFDGVTGKLIKDSGFSSVSFTPISHVGSGGASHAAFSTSVNGFVPSPGAGAGNRVLQEDGQWVVPAGGGTVGGTGAAGQLALWLDNSNIEGKTGLTWVDAIQQFVVASDDAGTNARPRVVLDRNSASPQANDKLGLVEFKGRSTADTERTYAALQTNIISAVDGSEAGRFTMQLMQAGQLVDTWWIESTQQGDINWLLHEETDGADHGPDMLLHRESPTPAADDELGCVRFFGEDSVGGVRVEYSRVQGVIRDPTNGSGRQGELAFYTCLDGFVAKKLTVENTGAVLSEVAGYESLVTDPNHLTNKAYVDAQAGGGPKTFTTTQTYAISGDITVGMLILPTFVSDVTAGHTVRLAGEKHILQTGTDVTFDITLNGAPIPVYSGIVAGTVLGKTNSNQALTEDDALALDITAITGTPADLTVTLVFEHTVI